MTDEQNQPANDPDGPLRTTDLIGLDTTRDTLLVLRELLDDPAHTPCPPEMVESGRLGKKSGRGFHTWRL
ncbi:3-hydroxyacyl-CoA dehydrogenase family protein [Saccharothrix saharensis]|uniref:3-hydroxyacyl-CoA dehydrogenase family protein n=1 Tax=Saccharothrix saharensis TaxID=571190 RepID=UPI00114E2148|nr:3-hydroxyacyl-CoA dehydrogenase family protein [Saccharothrix saharensis]